MTARVARVARALLAGDDTITLDELQALVQIVCVVRRIDADHETIREVCATLHAAYCGHANETSVANDGDDARAAEAAGEK